MNDLRLSAAVTAPPIGIGIVSPGGFYRQSPSHPLGSICCLRDSTVTRARSSPIWTLRACSAALALSVLVQSELAACQYLLARGIGVNASLSLFLFCVPVAGVFASLPLTVNGLGVREGAYLVLFGMAGMDRSNAIALGLLWFVSTALGALPGSIAFVVLPVGSTYSSE